MTPLAASISDTTIWSVTFDDTRSVNYDHNSFIIQATDDRIVITIVNYDHKTSIVQATIFKSLPGTNAPAYYKNS